jgi:hypothetical protein
MTVEAAKLRLDEIYTAIGGNELEVTNKVLDEIDKLEKMINPHDWRRSPDPIEIEGCGCDNPKYCWDCAAIRGGCPMDV